MTDTNPYDFSGEVVVHRIVDFELGDGDGRTLLTRVLPWDTPTQVSDPPHYTPYTESWERGAFDKQLKAANRVDVLLNFEHHQGISNIVGRGVELRNEADGLHGTFRMLTGQDADKALELVREQVVTGLSIEARALKSERVNDVVVRKDARLVNVALCRTPAFKEAQVLAVRQEGEGEGDEPPPDDEGGVPAPAKFERPAGFSEEEIIRLEALGIDAVKRGFVDTPWDGSSCRWPDAASYCRSSLVDNNPAGAEKTKAECHFPVRDPGSGDYNVAALRAVVGGRGAQANFPGAQAARARAKRLLDQYNASKGKS